MKIPSQKKAGAADVLTRLKVLNQRQRHATLATDSTGQPYTSLVAFALTPDLRCVAFGTPKKTTKYRNILRNNRVSLLIDSRSNSPRAYTRAEAVTVIGRAVVLRKGKRRRLITAQLARKHPVLAVFFSSGTTAVIAVEISRIIHVGSFQTVTALDVP